MNRCTHIYKQMHMHLLETSQNLQTNLLGGRFTLPLPPHRPLGSECCSRPWRTRGPLDPSKSFAKMCIICVWTRLVLRVRSFLRFLSRAWSFGFDWAAARLPFQLGFDRKCTCKFKFKSKFHFKHIANEHVNAHATGHEHENANAHINKKKKHKKINEKSTKKQRKKDMNKLRKTLLQLKMQS